MNQRSFRKATISVRRTMIQDELLKHQSIDRATLDRALAFSGDGMSTQAAALLQFSDAMVENAIGVMPVPLGVATGFLIDGAEYDLPLASEEPSVIAAAGFAATTLSRYGGFTTWASEPVMTAQIYLEHAQPGAADRIRAAESRVRSILQPLLASMETRGGGFREMEVHNLPGDLALRVHLHIDVRDAMGANLLNTCAESLRECMEELSGGTVLLAILSNQAIGRQAGAQFSIPLTELSRGRFLGRAFAERIVKAATIADIDPARGVTHNKGIMNGISALALATGNDTRGIEAAAHSWAARDGRHRALSRYWIEGEFLNGSLELPLPFGTVGGASSVHPVARLSCALLGNPDGRKLSRIAAALGLAQNFAALSALCSEGIQQGHMRLHERRLSWDRQIGNSSLEGT